MLYKSFYDLSISDSMASKVYGAIKTGLTGTLSITSNPTGAKVYVNGYYKGVTPINISLNPGKYSVKLTKDGYKDYVSSSEILTGKTTSININLAKIVLNSIVGKWKIKKELLGNRWEDRSTWNYFFEFLEDGTLLVTLGEEGSYGGSYRIVDENRVMISGPGGSFVCDYRIDQDYLTLTFSSSSISVFERVK